jgi:hypothetical protein
MKNSVGPNRTTTSRTEAAPKSLAQAENPAQQGAQIAINAEYLQRIKLLSEANENENYDFRSWLKDSAPDDIDDLVKALSHKYFTLIDCKECGNCCRTLELNFGTRTYTIAKSMQQSIDEFKQLCGRRHNEALPALKGNLARFVQLGQMIADHILAENRPSSLASTGS